MKAIEKGKNRIAIDHNEDTYGIIPERPLHLSVKPLSENSSFMDGIATYKELEMELESLEAELFGEAATDYKRAAEIEERKTEIEEELMELYEITMQ